MWLTGCGPKAYVRKGFLEAPPRRVAILPFMITYAYDLAEGAEAPASHQLGRDLFRKTFAHAFAPYGYEDLKLAEVDERLAAAWGSAEDGGWRNVTPQEVGAKLGVDALIYGEIHRLMYFSTPLYTETSLMATLRMVDARSGEELWRQKVQVAERGGALVQKGQVVDFFKDQVRSFNPRVKFVRVSDLAVKQALKGMPNPTWSASPPAPTWSADGKHARVAILPFQAKHTPWQTAAQLLRINVTANLQDGPFDVIEIQQVDEVLTAKGWSEGQPLPAELSLPDLARQLGADVLLRGTVTDWGRTYLVVQSWVKAGLEVELLDAHSGEVIWSGHKKNSRTSGILKGPTGYKSIATAPLSGLKTGHLERVANHLTRMLVDELVDSPAVMVYLSDQSS